MRASLIRVKGYELGIVTHEVRSVVMSFMGKRMGSILGGYGIENG